MNKYLVIDTETRLITAKEYIPELVCISWFDGSDSGIFHWTEGKQFIQKILSEANKHYPLIMHNAPFDLAVLAKQYDLLPLVFAALDRGAISDTIIREKLIHIAQGDSKMQKYSLKALILKYFDQDLEKDQWRMNYGDLRELPLSEWPEGAIAYSIKDSIVTGRLWEVQNENPFGIEVFGDEPNQNRANFALHLMSSHGIITDPMAIKELEDRTVSEYNQLQIKLIKRGLVRDNGTRDDKETRRTMEEAMGADVQLTPTGRTKTNLAACAESGNEDLKNLARYRQLQTLLNKDIAGLKEGIENPLHSRFDVLLNTGRTSSSGPNLQNPARGSGSVCYKCFAYYKDKKEICEKCNAGIPTVTGVRECYIPRSGYYFASADYDSAELHTLAQVCYKLLGFSGLRDKLNAGMDLHLDFAAQLLGITYAEALARKKEPEVKEMRQRAKVANFGFPGGMGYRKLADYAKGYNLELSEAESKRLRDAWLNNWPEMTYYFKFINSLFGGKDKTNVAHIFSNRYRGNVFYTEACNSFFQGLAADGAKDALYEVTKACYINMDSPLYGSRPVNFIHDQIIMEVSIEKSHEAAIELARVMIEVFNKWTPDVNIKAEPWLMKNWTKDAGPCYNDENKLVPWESK